MTTKGSIRRLHRIHLILLSITLVWILAACSLFATSPAETVPSPTIPAPTVTAPVLAETIAPTPENASQLGQTVTVYYETITLSQAESKPDLVYAKVNGNLPDPCSKIVNKTYYWIDDHGVELVITAEREPNVMCAQVLTPFEGIIEIDMTGKPAGSYTITAGDHQTTFEYQGSQDQPGKSSCPPRIPGSNVYKQSPVDDQAGFCFLYPYEFSETAAQADRVTLIGPARQLGQRIVNARVDLTIYPLESDKDLRQFILDYLKAEELTLQSSQEQLTFAGQQAVRLQTRLDNVISTQVFFVYQEQVYQLSLSPLVDGSPLLTNDLTASFDLIEKSWVFINEDY